MQHHDGTKHKAHYQLTRFIGSDEYYSFDLAPHDLAILFIISRYLDMPKGFCNARQTKLATECRMSERKFRNHCNYLVEQKLLFRYAKGKLYYYELGEIIARIDQ